MNRQDVLDLLDGTYYQDCDFIDQHMLVIKAVEVMKTEPDIDYHAFAYKVGLTERNGQLGLTGHYMQAAREIIRRQESK